MEALLGIAVVAGLLAGAVALVAVALRATQQGGRASTALALASEGLEAAQAIRDTSWHNIYQPPDGSGSSASKGPTFPYYVGRSGSAWVLTTNVADRDTTVDGVTYQRVVVVDNVSRDATTREIVPSGGTDDPATQRVTVTVAAAGLDDVVLTKYFTRVYTHTPWQQSDWSGGAGQANWSESNRYDTDDGNVDATSVAGSLRLRAQ